MEIHFETKNKRCNRTDSDVSLALCDNHKDRVRITFRNARFKDITSTGYMVVAVVDNRLYFNHSDNVKGWAVTVNDSNPDICYMSLTNKNIADWVRQNPTEYELLRDAEHHLYYIEAMKFETKGGK